MAYNEFLADRIRNILNPYLDELKEKKMMGGLTFMLKGKMCCGIIKDDLMVRVIDEKYEPSLQKPFCREMDFTGRALRGFLFVDAEGIESDGELKEWMDLGIEFVGQAN